MVSMLRLAAPTHATPGDRAQGAGRWVRRALGWALGLGLLPALGLALLAPEASAQKRKEEQEQEVLPPPNPAALGAATAEQLRQSVDRAVAHLRRDRPDLLADVAGFGALDASAFLRQDRDLRSSSRAFSALAVERLGPLGQFSCAEIARRLDAELADFATQPWQRDARWWLDRIERGLGPLPTFAEEPEVPAGEGEERSPLELELENLRALEALLAQRPFLRLRSDSVFSAELRLQVAAAVDRFAARRLDTELPWPRFGGERWAALHAKVLERFAASLEDLPDGEREDRTGAGRLNPGGWNHWVATLHGRAVEDPALERALLHGLMFLESFPPPDPRAALDLDALRGELIATVPERTAARLPATQLEFETHPAEPAPRLSWSQRDGRIRLVHRPQAPPWTPARMAVESILLGELAGSLAHACDLRAPFEGFDWRLLPDPAGCEALALAMGFEVLRRTEEPQARHRVLAQVLRARWADALFVLEWHGHRDGRDDRLGETLARRRGQDPEDVASDLLGLRLEPRQALPPSLAALWIEGWRDAEPKQRAALLERQWLERLGPK